MLTPKLFSATAGLVARVGNLPGYTDVTILGNVFCLQDQECGDANRGNSLGEAESRKSGDKAEKDLTDDDMVTISEGDKDHAAQKVRKGDGHEWLSYCHRPVDIKIVGVFRYRGISRRSSKQARRRDGV